MSIRPIHRIKIWYDRALIIFDKFDKPISVISFLIAPPIFIIGYFFPYQREVIFLSGIIFLAILVASFIIIPEYRSAKRDQEARKLSINPNVSILMDYFCIDLSEWDDKARITNTMNIRAMADGVRSIYLSLQYHGDVLDVQVIRPSDQRNYRLVRPVGEPGLDFEFLFDRPLEKGKLHKLTFEGIFDNSKGLIRDYIGKLPPYQAEYELRLELRVRTKIKMGFQESIFEPQKARQPLDVNFVETESLSHVWSIPYPDHKRRYNLSYTDRPDNIDGSQL